MKLMKHILSLSVAVLLLAGLVQGQFPAWVINVKVPFEFQLDNKTFPAGNYSIVRTAPYGLSLRNSQGRVLAVAMTTTVESAPFRAAPMLLFYVQGGEHYLIGVRRGGDRYELSRPKPLTDVASAPAAQVQATRQP